MNTKTRRNPSLQEIKTALQAMRVIAEPTPREKAQRRMAEAKRQFSESAALCMTGDKTAAAKATSAMQAVDRARAELDALDAKP
jgi:hypothetical protein